MHLTRRRFLTGAATFLLAPHVHSVSANENTIQRQLDASRDGSTVYLPSGVHHIHEPIKIQGRRNLHILGQPGTEIVSDGNHYLFEIGESEHVTVEQVAFRGDGDASKKGQTGVGVTHGSLNINVLRCRFLDLGYDAVHALRDVDGFLVAYCHINGCGDDGINPGGQDMSPGAHRSRVIGNVVENVQNDGIHVSIGSVGTTVLGNTLTRCGAGIGVLGAHKAAIQANTIQGSGLAGIHIRGDCDDLVVANNIIDGGELGIRIASATRWQVGNNIIRSARDRGILVTNPAGAPSLTDGLIDRNLITGGCSVAAVHLSSVAACDVTNNRFADISGDGVRLAGGDYVSDDIWLSENGFRNVAGQNYRIAAENTNIRIRNRE